MNIFLIATLLSLALLVFGWNFERYRTRFVKTDLLIGTAFALGLASIAIIPELYDHVGEVFNLDKRYVAVSFIANIALLLAVLYAVSGLHKMRLKLAEMNRSLSIDQAPLADGGPQNKNVIQPVIPAYNEGDTICDVIRSLPDSVADYAVEPIVVSDGSVDDTARKAEINGTTVVEHPVNQGQGGALQTGFEMAHQNEADIVVTMDGDGQHPAEELRNLVKPIIDDEADFVMGSRYMGTDYSGNGLIRRAGIRTFTWVINVLCKAAVTDCTNGFRAIRGSELEDMTLTEEKFSAPELIIEARKHDLRIQEIPITIEERQAGETKKPQLGYALGLTRTILVTWLR